MTINPAAQQNADLFLDARHVLTSIVYGHLDTIYTDLGDLLEPPSHIDDDWKAVAVFGVDALISANNAVRRATLVEGRVRSFLVPLLSRTGSVESTFDGRRYHVTQEPFAAPRIAPVDMTPTRAGGVRRGD